MVFLGFFEENSGFPVFLQFFSNPQLRYTMGAQCVRADGPIEDFKSPAVAACLGGVA